MKSLFQIPFFLVSAISASLAFGANQLKKLFEGTPYLQELVDLVVKPIEDVVKALADADPNDLVQIKAIFKQFFNEDFLKYVKFTLVPKLQEVIKQPLLRTLALHFANFLIDLVEVLTDDNTNNLQQVGDLAAAFIRSKETETIILESGIRPLLDFAAQAVGSIGDDAGTPADKEIVDEDM